MTDDNAVNAGAQKCPEHASITVIFWLSFADATRPAGQQFLGACMVKVKKFDDAYDSLKAALRKTHVLDINPGGEVQASELPSGAKIHSTWLDVLLDSETIAQHDTAEGWSSPRPHS